MPNRSRPPRRLVAALGLAVYAVGVGVAPLVHIVTEHRSASLQERARSIDATQFVDPRTGAVDLDQLATALGVGVAAHDESLPHSHNPGEAPSSHGSRNHGAGSLEHFGVALLAAAAIVFMPIEPAPEPVRIELTLQVDVPPTTRPFLAVQRAQAPPV